MSGIMDKVRYFFGTTLPSFVNSNSEGQGQGQEEGRGTGAEGGSDRDRVYQEEESSIRSSTVRLFSHFLERPRRKRPKERVIEVTDLEITDDEEEIPTVTSAAKRFKAADFNVNNISPIFSQGEMSGRDSDNRPGPSTRGRGGHFSGGKVTNIPINVEGKCSNGPSTRNKTGESLVSSTPLSHRGSIADHLLRRKYEPFKNQTMPMRDRDTTTATTNSAVLADFRFKKPKDNVEVVTVPDDDEDVQVVKIATSSQSSPSKATRMRQLTSPQKKGLAPPLNSVPQRPIIKQKTLLGAIRTVGRKVIGGVDPVTDVVRLEERNRYKELVQKFQNSNCCKLSWRNALHRSKLNEKEVSVVFNSWPNASPQVSLKYGQPSISYPYPRLSERVKQDLRLFSTPTASRSPGSTPPAPASPSPILIDLEDEKSGSSIKMQDVAANKASVRDFSMSFSNFEEAAIALQEDEDNRERGGLKALPPISKEAEDEDITIIAQRILKKGRSSLNSLKLEHNLSPYTNPNWLKSISSDWRDNEAKRGKEIHEALETVKVLKQESTLDRDLREDIRRKLTLTEIIVLEEEPPKVPEITDEMQAVIQNAMKPGNGADILAKSLTYEFTRKDAQTLAPTRWLNDTVINHYLALICERNKNSTSLPKVYSFTTFFYTKLLTEGYSNALKRWTRKVDIFSNDLVLFPIHLGMHWCMACADLRRQTIKYYDSLGGTNDKCLNALLNYLDQEMREKKKQPLNKSGWSLECVQDIPQQNNGSDCGVFTCKFGEYLSRDAELTFNPEHMDIYRFRMVYEIITATVMYP